MAKMKVHELAKELDVQSKDIITLLQDKGVEVKSHMSVLDDSTVETVKKKLSAKTPKKETTAKETAAKAPAAKAAAPKTEAPKAESAAPKTEAPKAESAAPKAEAPAKTEAPQAEAPAAPKKKKSIIFVSNPQNSKMPGGAMPKQMPKPRPVVKPAPTPARPAAPAQTGAVQPSAPATAAPAAAPSTASAAPAAVTPSAAAPTTAPAAASNAAATPTAPAASNTASAAQGVAGTQSQGTSQAARQPRTDRPAQSDANRDNRSYGNRDGQQRTYNNNYNNNNSYNNNGTRPSYGNRPQNSGSQSGYNRPQGQGGYNNNRPQGTGEQRPYNNNGQSRPYNNSNGQGQTRPYNNSGTGGGYGQRPYNNNGGQSRPYNNNGQSRPYGGGTGAGTGTGYRQGQGQGGGYNRPYGQNQGGGRPGGYGGQGGSRPYGDKDADLRSNDRPGNRYGKPQSKAGMDSPMPSSDKHRDEAQRRLNQERDKKNRKEHIYEEDKTIKKAGRFIKPEKKVEVVEETIKTIILPESLTIKELAEKMKIQPSAIVKKLFLQGQIVTVNQEISYEQAEEIAIEYDIICEQEVKVDVIEELLKEEDDDVESLTKRPPVICVMGHVDHGKTSLLDAIRKTNVTDREAGGITQHIGAYTVNLNGQTITFLDTPGHEAFTAMRMRGANATDIAILVVAADDGVMPQTVEAINHAKAAGIEIIVAVNKVDKPNANIERVKQELTEYELISEDWGGSTVFAPVSAKTGQGIPELLEMILLTADILELKANAQRKARGLVIEAELDKGRGPVATILVQKGTLHVGDFISAGASHGKVRAMIDDKGKRIKEAGPSTPVEILGLDDVPNAGEIFIAHDNDKDAKSFAETFIAQNKEKLIDDTKAKMSLDDLFTQIQAGNLKELSLIVKADVQGSVEAVKTSLLKLSNEEVVVKVIHSGVGAINESDVTLASASNAIIIGFNVRPDAQAKATSERESVDVRLYKVIYQAIEDVQAAMKGMLDPVFEEKVIGHAEVRQIFKASAVGNIAGSYVLDGMFQRGCMVRITREGEQVYEGNLASLKRFKDDVKEVKAGFECGLVFEDFDQMQELDVVEAYIMVEVPR